MILAMLTFSCIMPEKITLESQIEGENPNIIPIFDDNFVEGGYTYAYPVNSKITFSDECTKKGDLSLLMTLDNNDYSGAAIGFASIDLSKIKDKGDVIFWIRGEHGKEKFIVSLICINDKNQKVASSIGSTKYAILKKGEWQKVAIPLMKFPDSGMWWDETAKTEKPGAFDWKNVVEFRISILPSPTPFEIYLDDIHIEKSYKAEKGEQALPTITVIRKDTLNDGCYVGAFAEGLQGSLNTIKDFEELIGKKLATVMWYCDFTSPFPRDNCEMLIKNDYIPHITWEPWYWNDHSKVKLQDIVDGKWDTYITGWAKEIKDYGKPLMIRWGHEMNSDWYPWSVGKPENTAELYIKAYRQVHDIFTKLGVKNVQWIWCPNNFSYPNTPDNDPIKMYPGDEYVDWIGIDGYNFGTQYGEWMSFSELYFAIYTKLVENFPKKPIIIGEFASGTEGGDKAKWILNMGETIEKYYKNIKAFIWFHISKEQKWEVDSSIESVKAFRKIMRNPYFLTSGTNFWDVPSKYKPASIEELIAMNNKPPMIYNITEVSGTINIDAKIDEWNTSEFVTIDKREEYEAKGAFWGPTNDIIANLAVKYDDDNLYIAAKVIDDFPLNNNFLDVNIWKGDAVEFALSSVPSKDDRRTDYAPTDFHVGISTGNGTDVIPVAFNWQKNHRVEDAVIKVKKTEYGYILEAKIPFKEFDMKVKKGMKIDFDMAVDDADEGGERDKQIIWNGNSTFYKDPSVWGRAVFK